MSGARITAFVLASIILCIQTAHFSYFKFFDPHESVLNDYLDQQIKEAGSLDELISEYEKARAAVEAYEIERPNMEVLTRYQQQSIEPYKTMIRLEAAIEAWEKKGREYQRVWYQWSAGLFLFVLGFIAFRLSKSWITLAIIIAGLGEMIWWSSPTRMIVGALSEHERLLNAKLLLTIVTFVLLLFAWIMSERRSTEAREGDS